MRLKARIGKHIGKRALIILAIVAAFLAGRAVHAADFTDSVLGGADQGAAGRAAPQQSAAPAYGGFLGDEETMSGSQAAARGVSPQQQQYQKYIESRGEQKKTSEDAYAQQYQDKLAKTQADNEERASQQAAQKGDDSAGPQQQTAAQEQDQAPVAPVMDTPAPPAPDDGSALSNTYKPKLAYPYTGQ